jgi:amino acid transporter
LRATCSARVGRLFNGGKSSGIQNGSGLPFPGINERADSIGSNATSGWVLFVGLVWIAAMTYICYRGIEVSAWFQRILLAVELVMLLVFSVTALVRVGTGNHPAGSITPAWSWFNPVQGGFTGFVTGIILMLFIYWG